MKVLLLTSAYPDVDNPVSGVFIKEQAESIRKCGVEMDVFVIKGSLRRLGYLMSIPVLWQRLKNHYDIIHAHYGTMGWIGRMQGKALLIVSFMGDDILGTPDKNGRATWRSAFLAYANRILARLSQGVIVKTNEMKRAIGLPKTKVIPNGVDLELFKPISRLEACRQLALDPIKRYILFAANPEVPVKNFALAKKAFQTVKEKTPLAELIALSDKPHDEVSLYMNACDCLIMTSLHEGSPNTVKEAMACNLPIVSVDAGDVKEVIGGTRNCFVTSRNPEEIAELIIRVFNSGERSNGRENIGHLETNKIARKIIDVYKKVCKNKIYA